MEAPYSLLTSEAEYRAACDAVLALARREIQIFDRDLARLQIESRPRVALLAAFLQGGAPRRLRMVLHDPSPLQDDCPRLLQLIGNHAHLVEVRQTPDNLRQLTDTHVFADGCHGVRRFHIDQPRSALAHDNPDYLNPWRLRFEELWEQSLPCLRLNTTGL